jgi:hypothetical protein
MWTCNFKKILKVVFGWLVSPLEIMFNSRYELLTGVASFLTDAAVASHHSDATWLAFLPLCVCLVPFLALLMVVLVGSTRPLPFAVFTLSRTKVAPTASSFEACQVVMSRNSLVILGCSWMSS